MVELPWEYQLSEPCESTRPKAAFSGQEQPIISDSVLTSHDLSTYRRLKPVWWEKCPNHAR